MSNKKKKAKQPTPKDEPSQEARELAAQRKEEYQLAEIFGEYTILRSPYMTSYAIYRHNGKAYLANRLPHHFDNPDDYFELQDILTKYQEQPYNDGYPP